MTPAQITAHAAATGMDLLTARRSLESRALAQERHAIERRQACGQAVANWYASSVDSLCRQHDEITHGIASITARMDATDAQIAAVLADYRSVA